MRKLVALIHDYAGVKGLTRRVVLEGQILDIAVHYKDRQDEIGIQLICPDCGADYFQSETILSSGELGCKCRKDTRDE